MFVNFVFHFLDNDNEWHNVRENREKNEYFTLFLRHIFRPSCYDCQFRMLDSYADFTIGDCWNSLEDHPQLYDDKGVSTLIAHTEKAKNVWRDLKWRFNYEEEMPEIMERRFEEYIEETKQDKIRRQWKLFYLIQPWMSLEKSKIIWAHDKLPFVLRRKFNNLWKRNTK